MPFKPLLDYVTGEGSADNVQNTIRSGMSKITGINPEDLMKKRKSIAERMANFFSKKPTK